MTKDMQPYCDYLNQISALFQDNDASWKIQFITMGREAPKHHPTQTDCQPDIVAIRTYPGAMISADLLSWSHLEATGQVVNGQAAAEAETQAGTCGACHLQARPDLVSTVGILVGESDFKLFRTGACGILHTPSIKWDTPEARRLLYAWVWRLYHPDTDPSITIKMNKHNSNSRIEIKKRPTFTIRSGSETYEDLLVLHAGRSIGRRTIILARQGTAHHSIDSDSDTDSSNPEVNNCNLNDSSSGVFNSSIVIKEQYLDSSRIFIEGPILKKIHSSGLFPGVVECINHEKVRHGDRAVSMSCKETDQDGVSSAKSRYKTRIVLKDQGTRLADVRTVRTFLKGIYDALEITRVLFREHKILHRDISPNNVLIRGGPEPYRGDIPDYLNDMCFADYLLKPSSGDDNPDPESDCRQRLTTSVFLIDFDCSENQGPDSHVLGDPCVRMGTPTFMARMVRSSVYPYGLYSIPPMPDLDSRVLPRYKKALGNRLEVFPAKKKEFVEIPAKSKMKPEDFRHLLRYDAESVFWFAMWWCIQAQPAEKSIAEEKIPHSLWVNLAGESGSRNALFVKDFPSYPFLHSSYARLVTLLDEMREHLQGDLDYSKDEDKKNPEYVHEALQRVLLKFLVENDKEEFMDLQMADQPRSVAQAPLGSRMY
ncbi:hypothetical protein M408DRAFT_26973 [Serendipita vermifera MAFF 305830]|uniref:Fungal-type protein kinase domain-containing protein n=1 Tax=Serendipita vermifera MAFF 305830 TaxID=933852 RepID=A0A0C2WDE6_SERVB|nr:hypothetical protein M408DRAFT_26973 [Serendipita vermifera MAFF 305830]